MTTVTDNTQLNEAIINLSNAIKATNEAVADENFDFDQLDSLEDAEEKAENKFFEIIFGMMPKDLAEEMQLPQYVGEFKTKTIDKYILN